MVEHRLRPLTPSTVAPMAKAVAKIISMAGSSNSLSTAVVSHDPHLHLVLRRG